MQEGLAPTQFYEKTKQILSKGNGKRLTIKYKLSNAHIRNQGICVKQTFIIVRDLKEKALLGVPFFFLIGKHRNILEKGTLRLTQKHTGGIQETP